MASVLFYKICFPSFPCCPENTNMYCFSISSFSSYSGAPNLSLLFFFSSLLYIEGHHFGWEGS
uniref:Putative ovule protein n=1 Tax=Solanum chacoense TaxID=4108 RepID=A0A0V0GV69_SOLCH